MRTKKDQSETSTTVVVPFFNNAKTLRRCARSLLACQPAPDQIMFIDDGSSDAGKDQIADLPVTIISSQHIGRPAAINLGISKAKGKWILFTDADCIVPKDWVKRYLDLIEEGGYAGYGGNLLPSEFNAVEIAKTLRYVHEFETDYVLKGAYTQFCLNGNNMAIRKDAIEKAGGFDEGYFHGADADLTRKLLDAGYSLLRTPYVTTTHLKVDGLGSFLRTCYLRGSTIRFAMNNQDVPQVEFVRDLLISPAGNFLRDLKNAPRLRVFGKGMWIYQGVWASLVNLFAAWANIWGRIRYTQKLTAGGKSHVSG